MGGYHSPLGEPRALSLDEMTVIIGVDMTLLGLILGAVSQLPPFNQAAWDVGLFSFILGPILFGVGVVLISLRKSAKSILTSEETEP